MNHKYIKYVIVLSVSFFTFSACQKKITGICYCKYVNGEKKEFDMRSVDRNIALDSCNNILDKNANAFGGGCSLK